jgi:hypothetical protein
MCGRCRRCRATRLRSAPPIQLKSQPCPTTCIHPDSSERHIPIKHSEKICSVCGGHLISINLPPRNWEGYYTYSSRMGGKLCLLIGVTTLPLLRSRHKNRPIHKPHDLHRWFMINFASCFATGKAHRWETFPKCRAGLSYCLFLGPLFWECPHPQALPYT